jgi:3'-phosphoadenosine 5'-phosphosulfate sulfotransferase (PAPS reductase)/FAD synthetase
MAETTAGVRRVVVWFSCGATSAVAAHLAIRRFAGSGLPVVLVYCDTGSEHEDNARFLRDCERWLGAKVIGLKSMKYRDTWDVWEREKYIAGPQGAKCTTELKKRLRQAFEEPWDLQVFGYDADEPHRAEAFRQHNPEVLTWFPLVEAGLTKDACFTELGRAGIRLPEMYLLGYRNNNCIGCPKGGAGYWNKIRRDFPATFERMAEIESRLGARLVQVTISGVRRHVALRELPPNAGRYDHEPPVSCGPLCEPGATPESRS